LGAGDVLILNWIVTTHVCFPIIHYVLHLHFIHMPIYIHTYAIVHNFKRLKKKKTSSCNNSSHSCLQGKQSESLYPFFRNNPEKLSSQLQCRAAVPCFPFPLYLIGWVLKQKGEISFLNSDSLCLQGTTAIVT
jgi:hypothetical protein